jgi:UDP-N-acetylglucosamine--N-acetylmuramyl-(pentapeptide) pyrophosphoryl-undecaprenol N-acetylglucosamine transferase
MKREVSVATAKAPFVAAGSVRSCMPLVRPADVVVGVGGYVSVPAVMAARWAHRPIVLHEQNAIPSLSNRALARFSSAVGVSFGSSRSAFGARVRTVMTGNPVRAQIASARERRVELAGEARATFDLEAGRTTVAVFGGSLGALHLDQVVAGSLPYLRHRDDLQLIVLTGRDHLDVVASAATDVAPLLVRSIAFLDRIELALAVADLAVARAGAGHIAELTDCGVPSILVPYPHATDDHQLANATELLGAGAAQIVLDRDLDPTVLAHRIEALVDDPDLRSSMGTAAAAWSTPDADERVAALLRSVARS